LNKLLEILSIKNHSRLCISQ